MKESFVFLHDGYVVVLHCRRGSTEKVVHFKICYQTAVDDPEVRSTGISSVSKIDVPCVMLDHQLTV